MLRALLAALVVSALVLSPWSATAATGTVPTEAVGTVAAARNQAALRPGSAAGIKDAQGLESGSYWREAGLVIGAFVVIFVLMGVDDDDDDATTTTSQ